MIKFKIIMIKVYLNRNQLFKSNPIHNELLDPSVGYFIVDYKLLYILVSLYHFRRGRGRALIFLYQLRFISNLLASSQMD